tara:strand:- start:11 stop:1042 length:1032 start_codon:yes stop_codon:yes gene_type:complete
MTFNVLSLFDGLSAGNLALERAGYKSGVDYNYYASEVDQYAINVASKNFPNIIQLGDVCGVKAKDLPPIDLIIAGSPCQGFSVAGKQTAFDHPESVLFFEFIRLLKEIRPKYFLLENVKMKKEFLDRITNEVSSCYPDFQGEDMFGGKIEPILIDSALVSAQSRKRYYWTNIPNITQPEDMGILLKDILLDDVEEPMLSNIYGGFKEKKPRVHTDKSVTIRTASGGGHIPSLIHTAKALDYMNRKVKGGRTHWDFAHHSDIKNDKSSCVTANFYKGVPYNVLVDAKCIRKVDPVEAERLQTIPDNYTAVVKTSNSRRYRMIGNSWTISVISHIFNNLDFEKKQ